MEKKSHILCIDDDDKIYYNADLNSIPKLEYGCGLFHFKKN